MPENPQGEVQKKVVGSFSQKPTKGLAPPHGLCEKDRTQKIAHFAIIYSDLP